MKAYSFFTQLFTAGIFVSAPAVLAEKFIIDPSQPPKISLKNDEAARLKTLLSASPIKCQSPVSPADEAVLMWDPNKTAYAFLNLKTKALTPVSADIGAFAILSKFVWRDPDTLAAIGKSKCGKLQFISLDKNNGSVIAKEISISGEPVSLSKSACHMVLVRPVDPARAGSVILEWQKPQPGFTRPLAAQPMLLADARIVLINLSDLSETTLCELPAGISLLSFDWTDDDKRLAIVRGQQHKWARGPLNTPDSDDVKDSAGLFPPQVNPFILTNKVEIFRLRKGSSPKHHTIASDPCTGEVFTEALWSPDGKKLSVQANEPCHLKGREFPSYIKYSATNYRIYSPAGKHLDTLKHETVSSPYGAQAFLGPHRLAVRTYNGLSTALHLYHLKSGRLEPVAVPEGMIDGLFAFNNRNQLVIEFSSFQQPQELFALDCESETFLPLTAVNAAVKAANQVRVEKLEFTLSSGEKRQGYLIQPAETPFPPGNIPLCVWQEGGPVAFMNNHWCGNTEASHNILPNFGIATLAVPLPGRWGFGKAFLNTLYDDLNFGQRDIQEQMEISQQVIERGYTSRKRIGIYGFSYGGYFGAQTATTYPDFYAAASIQAPLLNLFDEYSNGFPYVNFIMGCTPASHPAEFLKDSPLQRAASTKTPMQLFTSSEDFLPSRFSLEFHDAVQNAGHTKSDAYTFLQDGHGLTHPNNQFAASQARILWFRQHLGQP